MSAAPDDRYGLGYALAAYVLIFAVVFGYLAWIHVASRRLGRRLDALERELAQASGRSRTPGDRARSEP